MSEEAAKKEEKEKKKKGGGKLPVILLLSFMLAAGGYFGMKSRGGPADAKPMLTLGVVQDLDEFLVNLNGHSYLRTNIALHFDKSFKPEDLATNHAAVRDAIILLLSSKGLKEVQSLDGKNKLKREIAENVNKILLQSAKVGQEKAEPAKPDNAEDWDSDTGPVLKVYFTSFATQ
jgi:flagellar basal body-associated protein FliL